MYAVKTHYTRIKLRWILTIELERFSENALRHMADAHLRRIEHVRTERTSGDVHVCVLHVNRVNS